MFHVECNVKCLTCRMFPCRCNTGKKLCFVLKLINNLMLVTPMECSVEHSIFFASMQ